MGYWKTNVLIPNYHYSDWLVGGAAENEYPNSLWTDYSDSLICRLSDSSNCLTCRVPDLSDCLTVWFAGCQICQIVRFFWLSDLQVVWFVWWTDCLICLILLISDNQLSENQLNSYSSGLLLWYPDIQYFIQPAILSTVYQHLQIYRKPGIEFIRNSVSEVLLQQTFSNAVVAIIRHSRWSEVLVFQPLSHYYKQINSHRISDWSDQISKTVSEQQLFSDIQ